MWIASLDCKAEAQASLNRHIRPHAGAGASENF